MGKTLQNQDSGISLKSTDPGCIKGLFHRFSNRKWNNAKRRIPNRSQSTGKLPAEEEYGNDSNNITDTHEEQGKTDDGAANSTEKLLEPGSRHKSGSMKSRIKAIIVEELSKRKGGHRRSESLPLPILERQPSIHHLEVSDKDPRFKVQVEDERLDYQDDQHTSVSSLLSPRLPNISDESVTRRKRCNLCAATLATYYFRLSKAYANCPVKDHILPGDKSIASLQDSKLSPDTVDLVDIRKDLFLKVFEDPNSLSCHHKHAQDPSTQKLGLQKFASFPMSHLSSEGVPILNSGENNEEVGTSTEGDTKVKGGNGDTISDVFAYIDNFTRHSATCRCDDDDEAPNHVVVWSKLLNNLPLDRQSSENQKNNELSHKHFKRLREKSKHSIEEPKKGRHRIFMDSILHKVPYGRRYWKNVKEDGDSMTEKGYNNGSISGSYSPFGKSRQSLIRASSFNGPCERYNQLLDSHCNTESNSCSSDALRLKTSSPSPIHNSPKLLERIVSMPNLRSYSFSRIEGARIDPSSMSPMRPALASIPSTSSRRFSDSRASSFKNQIQLINSSENGSQEHFVEGSETFKDSSESDRGEGSHHENRFIEIPSVSVHMPTPESDANVKGSAKFPICKDPELIPHESNFQETDTLSSSQEPSIEFPEETNVVDSRVETPTCGNSNKMRLDFEVDKRNEAEFNYVRDVLERSGFSINDFQLLGSRHWGEEGAVEEGSVFAEVGDKLYEFPGNEGSGSESCNRRILFDLINQVVSEIHDRSLSYWPMPVTHRSRVHPMPVFGHRVLKEVWGNIEGYLTLEPVFDLFIDDAVSRDLAKDDGWMNIQFEAEGTALELEDMIFHDLVLELVLP